MIGAARDGRFIPWDNDGDVGVRWSDMRRIRAAAMLYSARGLWSPDVKIIFRSGVDKEVIGFKLTNVTSGVYVDGLILHEEGDNLVYRWPEMLPGCRACPRACRKKCHVTIPTSAYLPARPCRLEHELFWCPAQTSEVLTGFFGRLAIPTKHKHYYENRDDPLYYEHQFKLDADLIMADQETAWGEAPDLDALLDRFVTSHLHEDGEAAEEE